VGATYLPLAFLRISQCEGSKRLMVCVAATAVGSQLGGQIGGALKNAVNPVAKKWPQRFDPRLFMNRRSPVLIPAILSNSG
jgi:hypothetical protein